MNNDLFEIRPITDNNLKEVLEVYQQSEDFLALGSEPKATLTMVLHDREASCKEKGDFCGIYTLSGKIVGVIMYVPSYFKGSDHVAFISLLMISFPWRNRGIGTRILKLVEDKIRRSGVVAEIQTAVQLNNPAALRFWQRNGYRVFGDPDLRPDQTVVSYLRKNLFPPEGAGPSPCP